MKIVVVYESIFGNCARVAHAVAQGLAAGLPQGAQPGEHNVAVVDVADALTQPDLLTQVDLLVAGGPTHDMSMTKAQTRAAAAGMAEGTIALRTVGLREWSQMLVDQPLRVPVAAFETRASKVPLPTSAGKSLVKRLRKAGFTVVAGPMAFHVTSAQGPLDAGELDRAHTWGQELLEHLTQ